MVMVAFKLQHGIHHVLQYLWPCKAAILGNVTDEENRSIGNFGKFLHLIGGLAYLRNTSRRRFDNIRMQRLDGIDDQYFWGYLLQPLKYVLC